MNVPRRRVLRLGGAAVFTGLVSSLAGSAFADIAGPAVTNLVAKRTRSIALHNLHTGESLNTEYWVNGAYVPEALTAVNKVMRDWRNNEIHEIDPKLVDALSLMRSWMDKSDAFQVISGFRSPVSNAKMHEASSGVAKNSLHMEGKAIDIRMPGCDLKNLHGAALKMRCGGVGFYPVSNFVHVDVGRVRTWQGA
jgi:uncharacterized protein YcbK (DUF882 family)